MTSKKAVLGKGLSALLPMTSSEEELNLEQSTPETPPSKLYHFDDHIRLLGRIADLEVDLISPNPYQPRQDFEGKALDELADSIRQLGIIQPITVRALSNKRYEVISGERRLRAARKVGLKRIPAFVRDADTEAMLEMAIVENIQREELNPVEVALGYQRLIDECGLTQEQVAEKISKSRSTVTNFLRLLKLPPRVLAALRDGSVSMGHARCLINVEDEPYQYHLLDEILHHELSVREVEERVRAWKERQEAATATTPEEDDQPIVALLDRDMLHVRDLVGRLRTQFSTQVQIKHKTDGSGRIELVYYSQEDLERLIELLTS